MKLLESYLSDRYQYVVYDNQKSETLSITCGVPQGSILGPLLFIMNDLCNVSKLLFTALYVDGTCVVLNGKSLNLIVETVNAELQLLSTWLKSNKLSLHTTKTYYAVFDRAKMKLPMNSIKLFMDKTNLREVECMYHSYIYPYFIYYIKSWGNASNCHLDPLFVLQNRILRILTFSSYDVPSESLSKHTNILPLY